MMMMPAGYPATPKNPSEQQHDDDIIDKYTQVPLTIKEEKETLGILNTRLRNVFHLTQKEHGERTAQVQQAKEDAAAVEKEEQEGKRKLDDARRAWKAERQKQTSLRVRSMNLKNDLNQKTTHLKAFEESELEHVEALKRMIREKKDRLKQVEEELNATRSQTETINKHNDDLKHKRDQEIKNLANTLKQISDLESELDHKAFDLVLKEATHSQHLDKLLQYGGKNVEAYFQELYNHQYAQGVAALDAKYDKLLQHRKTSLEADYNGKHDKILQKVNKHRDLQDQTKEEIAKLKAQTDALNKAISKFEDSNKTAEDKILDKTEQKRVKENEMQSLVVLQTSAEQDRYNLEKKIATLTDHNSKTTRSVNDLQKQLAETRVKSEKELAELDAQIALLNRRYHSVAKQLEESDVFLNTEIKKYEVLVEVAESAQISPVKKRRLNPPGSV